MMFLLAGAWGLFAATYFSVPYNILAAMLGGGIIGVVFGSKGEDKDELQ